MDERGQLSTPVRRLGAAVLDNLVLGGISTFLFIPVFGSLLYMYTPISVGQYATRFSFFGIFSLVPVYLIVTIVIQIYFWTRSQTIGKAILGMKVVDSQTHEPMSLGKMALREIIGKWISGLVFYLGYIWILIDKDYQGWHDKLIDSVVIDIEK